MAEWTAALPSESYKVDLRKMMHLNRSKFTYNYESLTDEDRPARLCGWIWSS